MLRIIGGIHRTRRLQAPPHDEVTRPYTARVRESVFAELRGHVEGARVLDLFAGVGTMGLEAVSRGAAEVVMVERDNTIFAMLEANIAALACGDSVRAVRGDALGDMVAAVAPSSIDILFCDPPYALWQTAAGEDRMRGTLKELAPRMDPDGWLVLRRPASAELPELSLPGWLGPEVHRHGPGMLVLYHQSDEAPGSRDAPPESNATESGDLDGYAGP